MRNEIPTSTGFFCLRLLIKPKRVCRASLVGAILAMCAIHLQYRFPTKTLQSGTPNIFAHFSFKMWWSLMRTHFMPKIFLILSYKNLLIAADAGPFWKKKGKKRKKWTSSRRRSGQQWRSAELASPQKNKQPAFWVHHRSSWKVNAFQSF